MFANALKSISSTPITSGYTVSSTVTSTAGPWKIYNAKKKSTGKEYSLFIFDKKSLDAHTSGLSRSSASAFKKVAEEVVERLKKEASSLAKFRHPGILEIVEPVEETRGGGLQFVSEAVTASLSSVLQEKDDQERHGGVGGRSSRYVTEDADGTRRRRELEIDELEIQKGLLQVSKALEFLHDNAGLVHGNLTPDAVLINAKSDWKISGFSFCGPPIDKPNPSWQAISLAEVLHLDNRLPRTVQMNLDYTSPDFVLDNNLNVSADMFSLGLLCIALYNSPHKSPLECNGSLTAYKRHFQSSQGVPTSTNNFLCSRSLPKELEKFVLPRLITRRPAQRMTAKEFQNSEYFDNILISTIRFLDGFPAKTPNEKSQFLRGLIKVLPSFPKAVMEKKVLPALLEELKDRDLISLILHNVFKIIELLPSGRRAFGDRVRPSLKEIFVTNAKQPQEKDSARDAGLMIVLEQLTVIVGNCSGKEFKDDILPIIFVCLESPTPTLVDAALRSLPTVLPVLDFSTIKNELFPVVAAIFSKTNSLAIKVRGLQAFVTLCGGSNDLDNDDVFDGYETERKKTSSSTALDKFTMQEKIVPLIKVIKTKEPAVMIAALNVLKVIGKIADADFVAMDILPILWSMSLGPLLDLKQFQGFMELIKTLSRRVEEEQIRKLQELGVGNGSPAAPNDDFMSFGTIAGSSLDATNGTSEDDFERLVKGNSAGGGSGNPLDAGWEQMGASPGIKSPGTTAGKSTPTPAFSWSTPAPAPAANSFTSVKAQQPGFRTVTPDLGRIEALSPTSTQFSQPLQPTSLSSPPAAPAPSIGWGATSTTTSNPWASSSTASTPSISQPPTSAFGNMSLGQQSRQTSSSFSLPPPPVGTTPASTFSLAPPPGSSQPQRPQIPAASSFGNMGGMASNGMNRINPPPSGLGGAGISMGGMMNNSNTGMGMGMGMMNNNGGRSMGSMMGQPPLQPLQPQQQQAQAQGQGQKGGLDKYASLL